MSSHEPYPRDPRVVRGLPVTFHSYRPAGTVGETAESAFELVMPGGQRVWLPYDAVFNVQRRVRLMCEEGGLGRICLPGPPD